ncbi:MAG TPA: LamG domain-containing protein, partial [Acidimicrobiales bacterium]
MPSHVARRRGLTYTLTTVLALGATLVAIAPSAQAAPPPDTTITSNPAVVIATTTATFAFISPDPGTFECQLDGGTWDPCTSPQNYLGLSEGAHTFAVRAVDLALDVDPTPATWAFAVDTTAPDTSIVSGPTGFIGTTTAAFGFTSSEPGTFECQLDGGGWQPCTSPQNHVGLPEGAHTFAVRAVDLGLNVDPTPATRAFSVDTTAPTVTITTPTPKQHVLLHQFSPSFSCDDPLGGLPPVSSGIASCVPTPGQHDLGPHLFSVTATDNVGNEFTSASVPYVIDPPRYGDLVLASSPMAYYRLDQPVGATTMVDSSGFGRDGLLVNGAVTGSRRNAGIACETRPHPPRACELANDPQGWATHFGNRGYGYVNQVAAPRTAYTLEAWIHPDDRDDASIMGQGGAGQLYLTNGRLALRQTQDDLVAPGPLVPVGEWTHVAATWNGSTTQLYVNGVVVASSGSTNKPPSGSATLYVGQGEMAPPFRGMIDEAAFYATALSTHTLRDHWMVGTAFDHPSIAAGASPLNTAGPSTDPGAPKNNGLYAPAKVPVADFDCTDPDGPADIATCTATVDGNPIADGAPLPSSLGAHTFTVTATDLGGNVYVHDHTYTVASFADIYRADNPVVYYRLGDAGQVMADASGNARHGEYKNHQQSGPVGISGDGDSARRFWGDSGYGFSNGVAAPRYQSTIEAWVNPDDTRDQSIGGLSWSDELYVQGGRFVYR